MHVKTSLAVAIVGMLAAAPVLAQTKPTPAPGSKDVIPEKKGEALQSGRSESLSSKLNRTNGVIKPKGDIDPGIHTGAPDATPNSTPVIPPSATGGGTAK